VQDIAEVQTEMNSVNVFHEVTGRRVLSLGPFSAVSHFLSAILIVF
jgi:hypothetical protein